MEKILIIIGIAISVNLPLLAAWLLDRWLGDPTWLPHPVVAFGKLISFFERHLNRGKGKVLKGTLMTLVLVLGAYCFILLISHCAKILSSDLLIVVQIVVLFFCLAGTTLIREVRMVFKGVDRSLEEGRAQVARIVGRDTSTLSAQEVRTAALETLAENLSDGVIAPLFWYMILGIPGIFAYKMINTLDSMIGYKNERYGEFGRFAARLDDVANYLPARITAFLMIVSYSSGLWKRIIQTKSHFIGTQESGTSLDFSDRVAVAPVRHSFSELLAFVDKYGKQHASPNSGYPEAALAGMLDCRFGGTHHYFGKEVHKPHIGNNDRLLSTTDMKFAVRINRRSEDIMIIVVMMTTALLSHGV